MQATSFMSGCLLIAGSFHMHELHGEIVIPHGTPEVRSHNQEAVCPSINGSIITTNVLCEPYETGSAIFIGSIIGGVQPVILDWDKVSTPWNDDFGTDENTVGLADVAHGDYYFIARDALNCADTLAFTISLTNAPSYYLTIDPFKCSGSMGSISLDNLTGPPMDYTLDWDWDGTTANDDYGPPPATDDPPYISGLPAGTYYLLLTFTDHEDFTCLYYDTVSVAVFNRWDGSESIDWENPANWTCNEIPNNLTEVHIPNDVPHFPLVKSAAFCCRLDVRPGASLTVGPNWSLTVNKIND